MRADALRRRIAIIEAACAMFKRHGNSVSLEKIAQEAGVGVATLYRNFPDREALIHACAEHMSDGFLVFQNRLIEDFESDPSDAENFVLDYALKLTTMGLTSLIPSFAPEDLDTLPEHLKLKRDALQENGERFIELGKQHEVIGPGVGHLDFVVGILTLVRPRKVQVENYVPDIQKRMLRIYLAGIKSGITNA
ncbi:helix-turn-helix domain-containing protein [Corynebacterium striatum]|uniref:TetR/AcrR family transcriptional regulator n=2 Tax=Corynebacterium TaxID=1716 RepID=UPI001A3123CF|nr:TetR/AcrR family transcriptional regulator [Corynebacterium striatum]MDK8813679.1 helix-turn-helix domain-containing protein [Corynebacterium striatum]HAT1549220.1 TetR/AcrR family transcriptional regulator [Corynebacterium striatum]